MSLSSTIRKTTPRQNDDKRSTRKFLSFASKRALKQTRCWPPNVVNRRVTCPVTKRITNCPPRAVRGVAVRRLPRSRASRTVAEIPRTSCCLQERVESLLPEVRKKPRLWNTDYANRGLVASICLCKGLLSDFTLSRSYLFSLDAATVTIRYENGVEKSVNTPSRLAVLSQTDKLN